MSICKSLASLAGNRPGQKRRNDMMKRASAIWQEVAQCPNLGNLVPRWLSGARLAGFGDSRVGCCCLGSDGGRKSLNRGSG